MKANLSRYDRFGWDYEQFNPTNDDATAWYLQHARETGGPVLELACGTGRLVAAIAEAGFNVTGMDLSATMIEIAQRRVDSLPPDVRTRISLRQSDMTAIDLKSQFGLILIADNSFGELRNRGEQVACLRSAHNHLVPGGLLLVTVRRFDASRFRDNHLQTDWTSRIHDPVTGDSVRRRLDLWLLDDGATIRGVIAYEFTDADSHIRKIECPVEKPVLKTPDYLSLFADAGFNTQTCSGYGELNDDGSSPVLGFVCEKAGNVQT